METIEITMIVKVSYENGAKGDESVLAHSLLDAIRFAVDDGLLIKETLADLSWVTAGRSAVTTPATAHRLASGVFWRST